jgi:hypothetical protein
MTYRVVVKPGVSSLTAIDDGASSHARTREAMGLIM